MFCFDDIIKTEEFGFDDILIDEKLYENVLVYNISYITLIGVNPIRIRFNKVHGFIKIYDGTRCLKSFELGKYQQDFQQD